MIPFADLHCHSCCSDGSFTPQEILELAHARGFKGLSITDHDTVAAYKNLPEKAQALGLELISGVEFSCVLREESVHILGYHFDLDSPSILNLCQKHAMRREERNLKILEKLAQNNMPLTYDDVKAQGGTVIGRPHIALAMIKKGYASSLQEAFRKHLGEGRPSFATGLMVTVPETIEAIHQAKGKAIIAHPHLIQSSKILNQLLEMPFDGLEGYYANFLLKDNKRWLQLAEKKGWLVTGGSDFHGTLKPNIEYGASYVDERRFRLL